MTRIGLIRNAKSHRNRKPDAGFRARAEKLFGDLYAEPSSPAEIPHVLADFAKHGVELLIVDGGDGTLHKVLGALPSQWVKAPPRLAIMASGNTNLVAADVGCRGRGVSALRRIVDTARSGALEKHLKRRTALEVEWKDGSHPLQRGMFFGAAAFTRGVDIAHHGVHKQGLFEKSAVVLTIFLSLTQSLRTETRQRWLDGDPMLVRPGDGNPTDGNRFLFLATGLQKMFFGIWPFWDGEESGLRYLDIDAHPEKIIKAGAALLRGKSPQWVRDHPSYRSGGAEQIELRLLHRFVLDGEVFEPGPSGNIVLRSGPKLEFLVL